MSMTERDAKIAELWAAGQTSGQIAEVVGISDRSVRKRAIRLGLKSRARGPNGGGGESKKSRADDERDLSLLRLRAKGYGSVPLARVFGFKRPAAVRTLLQRIDRDYAASELPSALSTDEYPREQGQTIV
jgi:hypothetical protein